MDDEAAGRHVAVVPLVARVLETAHADQAARQQALMYAEAIDDADEPDAVLRFGPRLEACLESLGVAPVVALGSRTGRRPAGSPLAA